MANEDAGQRSLQERTELLRTRMRSLQALVEELNRQIVAADEDIKTPETQLPWLLWHEQDWRRRNEEDAEWEREQRRLAKEGKQRQSPKQVQQLQMQQHDSVRLQIDMEKLIQAENEAKEIGAIASEHGEVADAFNDVEKISKYLKVIRELVALSPLWTSLPRKSRD